MDLNQKLELVRRNSLEVINGNELGKILKKKEKAVYCGYETSGEVHLGHLVTMTKLLDLQKVGFNVIVLFADWHTWLNRKGDWAFIHKEIKIWEKAFKAAGLTKAKFILGSKFQRNMDYIDDIFLMSLDTTLNRALRSMQQVARDIENAKVSQVLYPFMQIEDIKSLKVDVVVSGIEQRKIHMLGKELFKEIKYKEPVFIHLPLICSLKGPGKMSSSDPNSMISIKDDEKTIRNKIKGAYCLSGDIKTNPILDILRLIIFPRVDTFKIKRPEKFGGDLEFKEFSEVEKMFSDKKMHPLDLKNSVSNYLVDILAPIRKSFYKK